LTTFEFTWRFLSDNSDTLGILVALVASLLAFAGLWVSAGALRRQSRSLDAATYLDIRHRIAGALRSLRAAVASGPAEVELIELLTLLDGVCGLYRRKGLSKAIRGAVKGELISALHVIDATAVVKDRMAKIPGSASAFVALTWFREAHKAEIARFVAAL
jgi:hypothetical protein